MNTNKTTPVEIIGEEIFFSGDKVEATPLLVKLAGEKIGQLEKQLEMPETVDEIIAENTHRKYTIFPFDYWRTLSATDRRNIAVYLRAIAATVESPALADESSITR